MKEEKVSMPMTSAGIVGFSPDIKIAGLEIEPKTLVIATVALVVVVKLATVALGQ
ncbi:MAG: preprotein translocase subunit Sec61beta [Candidatus ainarchaeum sp.]|nr:preprotein translocase subunit Sec61beta [Candidatus ainarchaeum sp.]